MGGAGIVTRLLSPFIIIVGAIIFHEGLLLIVSVLHNQLFHSWADTASPDDHLGAFQHCLRPSLPGLSPRQRGWTLRRFLPSHPLRGWLAQSEGWHVLVLCPL